MAPTANESNDNDNDKDQNKYKLPRTRTAMMNRKRAAQTTNPGSSNPYSWDTYALLGEPPLASPGLRELADMSVSLSYASSVSPQRPQIIRPTHATDAKKASMAVVNQDMSFPVVPDYVFAAPSVTSHPDSIVQESTKKPRYAVTLSTVLAAQEAAQKTFISHLHSKVLDLQSVDLRPLRSARIERNYKDMLFGDDGGWDTMAPREPRTVPTPYQVACRPGVPVPLPEVSITVDKDSRDKPLSGTTETRKTVRDSTSLSGKSSAESPSMPESFHAVLGKEAFLHSIRSNRFCSSLLEERVDNMCFFVEQPRISFHALNAGGKLDKLGPFASDRWKHMEAIHCIFPNRTGQAYFVQHLACTHYQAMFSTFVSAIEDGSDDIMVKVYYPVRDYENDFVVIWNKENTLQSFSNTIQWSTVSQVLDSTASNHASLQPTTARQARRYQDFGFTSGICTSRRNSANGVSKPVLKPGTLDGNIVNIFVTGSNMVRAAHLPWLTNDNALGYDDKEHDNRNDEFSKMIHKDNIVEACRLHGSSPEAMCGVHTDRHNSAKPCMSLVVGYSQIIGKERLGVTYYARDSADAYLASSELLDEFTRFVLDTYRDFPDVRRGICPELLNGGVVMGLFGVGVVTNPCNLDPSGYHQATLFLVCSMSNCLALTLPEVVSVVSAYDLIPDNPYYFYLAVRSILSSTNRECLPRSNRGYALGYLIGSLMLKFNNIKREKDVQVPGRRFPTYSEPRLPDRIDWIDRCNEKLVLILHINSTYPSVASKAQRYRIYRDMIKRFSRNIPNQGDLKTNHSLAILSSLGILPPWVREHAEISPSSRYMKWFMTKFPLPTPMNSTKLERIISTLRAALEAEFGRPFTIREVENILCKVFRITKDLASDRRFNDILVPKQDLFEFAGTSVHILNPRNRERTCLEGCGLINRWMVGDSYLSMSEIVDVLGIPNRLPSDAAIPSLTISPLLHDGRWDGRDEMKLNDGILLESRRDLTAIFNCISQQLRS
jgi:hypothetical protein